jgi:pimeloyl-ACP methyl ester carboxylesterase
MVAEPFGHAHVQVNGIAVQAISTGIGPLVVFCHGFPESWYSWRHQLPVVAEAGFRAMLWTCGVTVCPVHLQRSMPTR